MNEDTLSYFMAMLDLAVTGLLHFTQIPDTQRSAAVGASVPLSLCVLFSEQMPLKDGALCRGRRAQVSLETEATGGPEVRASHQGGLCFLRTRPLVTAEGRNN